LEEKSNPHLLKLVEELKRSSHQHDAPVWKTAARRLDSTRQHWAEVNLTRVARHAKKGETLLVPGKLLGSGEITFPVTVAAWSVSVSAREKVLKAGGKVLGIGELLRTNPKGKAVRIFG